MNDVTVKKYSPKNDATQTKSVTISVGKAASLGAVDTTAPAGNFVYDSVAGTGTLSSWKTENYTAATYNLYYSTQAMTTSNFATVGNKIGEVTKKDSDAQATGAAFTITNATLAATASTSASGYYAITVVPSSTYYESTTETFKACSAALVGQTPVLTAESKITSIVVGETTTAITAQVYPRFVGTTLGIESANGALTIASQTLNGTTNADTLTKNANETLETWVFTVNNNQTNLKYNSTLTLTTVLALTDTTHTIYTDVNGRDVEATQVLTAVTLADDAVTSTTNSGTKALTPLDQFGDAFVAGGNFAVTNTKLAPAGGTADGTTPNTGGDIAMILGNTGTVTITASSALVQNQTWKAVLGGVTIYARCTASTDGDAWTVTIDDTDYCAAT